MLGYIGCVERNWQYEENVLLLHPRNSVELERTWHLHQNDFASGLLVGSAQNSVKLASHSQGEGTSGSET